MTKDMTNNEVQEAFLYLKNQKYDKLRTYQKAEESYYFQTFNPFPEDTSPKPYITHHIKPPRGRRIVDGPADWLSMDKVIVHIPPKARPNGEITPTAQKEADNNELWAQALIDYSAMVQPYYLRMDAQQLPLRGEAWLKIDTDWEYPLDTENYEGIPFKLIVPDAMMVYATLDLDFYSRPNLVFEEKVHTMNYLKDLINEWNPKHKKQADNTLRKFKEIAGYRDVSLVEWCTKTARGYFAGQGNSWNAIPIDGKEIVENLAGVVPYIRGFTSLGIWPYDGDLTKLVVGYLRPMGDVIVQDARDRSKVDTITNYWAAPVTSWITDGNTKIEDADKIIGPGYFYTQIKSRKELKIEPAPAIPSSLIEQIRMNEGLLEEYDPMILRGRAQSGETAIGQNQRVGLGLQKWEPLKITLRQMIANAMSTVFQIVEKMDVPVKIFDHEIAKLDIDGYYKNEIDIKPGNPEERMKRMLLAKDMDEYLTDDEQAEMMGIENVTEHVRKLNIKKMTRLMLQTPNSPLWNLVWGQTLKELDMEDVQAEMDELFNMTGEPKGKGQEKPAFAGGPVVGGHNERGTPGVPNVPPVAEPEGQEELQAAMNAMNGL